MNSPPAADSESTGDKPLSASRSTGNSAAKWFPIIRWIALLVGVVSALVLVRNLPTHALLAALEAWISSLGMWGPVVLILAYIIATILFVPGTLLTLLAGALFGLTVGTITVSIGSTLGAAACFLIARYGARDRIADWARRNPRFGAIDRAIGEGGWKIVALLRLSPAIPFNVQNYLYGLTLVRFWPFLLASWLAMLPGTFLYVYLGHLTHAALGADRARTPGEWILLGVGLAATLAVSVYIARLARSKIGEQVDNSNDVPSHEETSLPNPSEKTPAKTGIGLTVLLVFLAVLLVVLAANSHRVETWLPDFLHEQQGTGEQHESI